MKKIALIIFMVLSFSVQQLFQKNVALADFEEEFLEFDESETDFSDEGESDFSAYAGKVHMEGLFLDGNILKISVLAEDLNIPTVGIAFHLDYQEEKLHFLRYEPGEFLEDGGDPFYMVQNDIKSGEIIFGETLKRDDRFPIGGKLVTNFYFQIIDDQLWQNEELLKFDFEKAVVSTLDTVRQDIQNVQWENLHIDENGANHWQQNLGGDVYTDGKVNILSNSINDSRIWKWLFIIVIACLVVKKIVTIRMSKNKDKKRHIGSVNFK